MSSKSDNNGNNANRMTSKRRRCKIYKILHVQRVTIYGQSLHLPNANTFQRRTRFFSHFPSLSVQCTFFIRYAIKKIHLLIFSSIVISHSSQFFSRGHQNRNISILSNLHWNFNEVNWTRKLCRNSPQIACN